MKQLLVLTLWAIFCLPVPEAYAQDRLATFIDSLILNETRQPHPGGTVLVARGDSIIYKKSFGMADAPASAPIKDDMDFYIGSNTKQFTAVSILQLMERGKLSLEDSLAKFVSCRPPRSSITIRQLLAQTSGLAEQLDSPMRFSPGTKWEYNNENYQLLGTIIGKISGLSYADYLHKNIFQPAGMAHTSIERDSKAFAAGGIHSTVVDMFKWNQALKSGKLLKSETLRQAFTAQKLSNGESTPYGFGWRLGELQGSPILWHGGLIPGYSSETLYCPLEDVYVVTFLHSDTSKIPLLPLTRIIGAMAIGKPYGFTETAIDSHALRSFTGVYEDPSGFLLNISLENGKLFFQRANGQKYPILYAGAEEFFFNKDYLRITFLKDSSGHINRLLFSQVGIAPTAWQKTARPLLSLAPEPLSAKQLKQYAGKYILAAGDTIVIILKGPNLVLHMPDRDATLLIAETTRSFYSLTDDLRIDFPPMADSLLLNLGPTKRAAIKMNAL